MEDNLGKQHRAAAHLQSLKAGVHAALQQRILPTAASNQITALIACASKAYNACISACKASGKWQWALWLFHQMKRERQALLRKLVGSF